jgi:methylmalonyl-CoA mutase
MSDADRASPGGKHPGMDDWRRLVEKALKGGDLSALSARTRDGITLEPLYERSRSGAPLPGRGAHPWRIVQPVDAPDPDEANALALADLEGGATGLSLRLTGAASAGGFGLPADQGALRIALEDVDLAAIHLRLEPHAEGLAAVRWLKDIATESGTAPELTDIAFGLDPVAKVMGGATPDPDEFAACFRELAVAGFIGPIAALDGRIYHEAGASEAQELAGLLAAAAWWLRTLAAAGIAPSDAMPYFGVSLAVDREQYISIAKLRALRLAWARLQELCDVAPSALAVHAETSRRMLTRADPTTNLLRTTVAALAAGVAGADTVTVLPHTAALGLPDRNTRALACNIQHLLIEEAHVFRVADPAAGSGALEALTHALAERAWSEFQTIEQEGGIVASLEAGALQTRIADARAALQQEVADGEAPLVGATIYPAPDDAKGTSETTEEIPPAAGLPPVRLEALVEAGAR